MSLNDTLHRAFVAVAARIMRRQTIVERLERLRAHGVKWWRTPDLVLRDARATLQLADFTTEQAERLLPLPPSKAEGELPANWKRRQCHVTCFEHVSGLWVQAGQMVQPDVYRDLVHLAEWKAAQPPDPTPAADPRTQAPRFARRAEHCALGRLCRVDMGDGCACDCLPCVTCREQGR